MCIGMSPQKLMALFYIVGGFAVIFIFASKLLLQLLAIVAGLFMIRHGMTLLNPSFLINKGFAFFMRSRNR